MKWTKHLSRIIPVLVVAQLSMALLAVPMVSAGPFDASKSEVCKGANLGTSNDCKEDEEGKRVNSLVAKIINILSFVVGVVAVVMIIINGLRLITSNGDSNSISGARNGIIYAVIGLILVASAQLIVRFVLTKL